MSGYFRADRASDRAPANRSSNAQLVALRVLTDLLAVVVSFLVAFQGYVFAISRGWLDRPYPDAGAYVTIAVAFAALTLVVFAQQGLYRGRSTILNLWELGTAVKSVLLSAALLFAVLFFLDLEQFSRVVIVSAIAVAALLVVLERRAVSALVRRMQLRGAIGRRTLIYGCGKTGQLLMKKVLESPHLGSTVVGFLDDHVPLGSRMFCRITQTDPRLFEAPVVGRLEDLERVVEERDVEELLIVEDSFGAERQRELVERAESLDLVVGFVPTLGDVRSDQLRVEELSAIPVLRPARPTRRRLGRWAGRAFDLAVSVVVGVVSAPAWILAAVAARWESGSPVLFRQQRVGRDGEPFQVLKFRTMTGDAPPYASSPPGDADPRITRTGAILRKTGLDELPQLINVIRGEMSIVGPRPEMPHLVQEYGPVERLRLSVKPGITGLWQLSADRHAEIHENIEYDLYYVHHQSLLLDLLILLETAFFTVGIVLGYFDRRSTRRSISHPAPMPGGSEDEYVLVALDQRWEDEIPANWRRYLPPLREISDQWPVRIVVAEDNRSTVDRMLRESTSDEESDVLQTTYAPYRSRDELRHLVAGARLVITDLEHVTKWTEEESVDALTAEEGGLRWSARSRVPDPIVSRLSELVTIFVGSEFTAVAERDRDPTVISITGTGT